MKVKLNWKKLFFTITIWLVAEVILTFLGIDNLADYGEFLLNRTVISSSIFLSIAG